MMYIGPDKIKNMEDLGNFVKVNFEGKNDPLVLSRKMYDVSLTIDPVDLTQLRDRQLLPIMGEVVKVLLDWDIKFCDIDPLFMRLNDFLNDKMNYAFAKIWMPHLKNKPSTPDWHYEKVIKERTIGDIDNIFQHAGKNKDSGPLQGNVGGVVAK